MLGEVLREEREKQNFSVKDVEQETSIRALYISAIEEGKYEILPGEVYLKGFIRTYASFLQLDGAAMLKLYYEETAPAKAVSSAAIDIEETEQIPERKTIREMREEQKQATFPLGKMIAGLLVVVCVGGLAYWGLSDSGNAAKVQPPVTAQIEKKPVPTPPKQAPAPIPAPVAAFVELQAKYTGACWTKVEADGKVIFEGTAQEGENLTWKAQKELIITAGNAGALELVSKGKSLGKLGGNGEVLTKKFAPENAAAPK